MTIYWINLTLVLFWSFYLKVINIGKRRYKKVLMTILFLQLYLLLALRSSFVGADLRGYLRLFNFTKLQQFWDFNFTRHEVGYIFLNKLLQFINNEQIFIALISIIPLFLIFKFIYEESKIPWLSVFLFITLGFYTNCFNLLRQVIAMSIVTISYRYLVKNELKKFVLTVLLAAAFHATALVFLLVYYFRRYKMSMKSYLSYTGIAVVLSMGAGKIIYFALNHYSSIGYEIKSNGGEILLIILITILIGSLLFKKEALSKNKDAIILYNIQFFAILIQILALNFALFTRVMLYFLLFAVILIPEVISNIKSKSIYVIAIILTLILTSILYLVNLYGNFSKVVPYHFFWN